MELLLQLLVDNQESNTITIEGLQLLNRHVSARMKTSPLPQERLLVVQRTRKFVANLGKLHVVDKEISNKHEFIHSLVVCLLLMQKC